MYFALLGKTPHLSLAELELIHPEGLKRVGSVVFFDCAEDSVKKLNKLGGVMKWGKVLKPRAGASEDVSPLGLYDEVLKELLDGARLVGTNNKTIGMRAKKLYGVKRFKEVEIDRADLDVKKEGIEILDLGNEIYGHVRGRQNIDRFAAIDFDKPGRGMQIGMMPAKLTQVLVNIGVKYANHSSTFSNSSPTIPSAQAALSPSGIHLVTREGGRLAPKEVDENTLTVYDPFCGFGTTLFVANSLGYHAIGSDINSTLAKKNVKRRPTTERANNERYLTLFRHDVHDPFTKKFLQAVNVIVTEGWLGPVVKSQNAENKGQHAIILKNIEAIVEVYRGFLSNVKEYFTDVPVVMTVPVYDWLGDVIEQRITVYAEKMGLEVTPVGEVYQRKKQTVGRRVLVVR